MLDVMKEHDAEWVYREMNHTFVESSTFADDYKYRGEAWQGPYHFVQIPWIQEDEKGLYEIRTNKRNLTAGVRYIVEWLARKDGRDYMESDIYTYLMNKFNGTESVAESYALRLLIHCVGDSTQPLHNINRFSEDEPKGDKGGNGFKLKNKYSTKTLHSLWDKVLYQERKNIARPISNDDWLQIQETINNLMD